MAAIVCQRCKQRPASIHITELLAGGGYQEAHVCLSCCREVGWDAGSPPPPVAALLTPNQSADAPAEAETKEEMAESGEHEEGTAASDACPECGLRWDDYRKVNLLGCTHDWSHFASQLVAQVKRWHSADRHVGRRPGEAVDEATTAQAQRRAELAARLAAAVADERYEEAARLRDELRRLEGQE
ncbi:MAG: UvrB/UvrC motif-containing protein [Planctomycetota bacterium]|nr:UvrB/UvrC motif-containing protein [Planctomycetota bacterium]MCX8039505.1 UvrB/UvrC motif-containing protein [Planctomycetota bacterium]MDW8373024.1 UvrB/UvrC motif-containing protein [Planctomycetota bacterium]